MRAPWVPLLILCAASALPAAKTMDVYFIDVEGGQATLIVSPSGQSMLVDTGWPGNNSRDAERIAGIAKHAGVKQIDYLVITHYHDDHVGGVPQLAARLPIRNFVDHGESVESGAGPDRLYKNYIKEREKGTHLQVKPGDKIPVKGLDIEVVTSAGQEISAPLSGAGAPNPSCADVKPMEKDEGENAQSVGTMIAYGRFRMIDLGDLTWNKENELVCPDNKLGTVSVYLTTHHGMDISNSPAIVHAVSPEVAIMNNGAKKGGKPQAWQTVHGTPGLQDIWQLHFAVEGGKENNAPDAFIANVDETGSAWWIKLSVLPDGSFTVTNSRNKYTKSYPPRS